MNGWRWSIGRLLLVAFCGASFWWLACCWTGPLVAYRVPMAEGVAEQIIGFSQRGELIAAGVDPDQETSVRVLAWKGESKQPTVVWREKRSTMDDACSFTLSANRRWLGADTSETRAVVDLESFETIAHKKGGTTWVSPDGRFLFNDDRQAGLEVSELKTGKVLGRIDDSWIHDISPNGEWVLASTGDGLRLWRVGFAKFAATTLTFKASQNHSESAIEVGPGFGQLDQQKSELSRFSPDNRLLVVSANNHVRVWQLDPLTELLSSDEAAYAISADCRRAWLSDERVMTLPDGKTHQTAAGRDDGVTLYQPVDDNNLFVAIRQPTWNSGGGFGGFSIPVGPYQLSLARRDPANDAAYCLIDAVSGREISIPRSIARPYGDTDSEVIHGGIYVSTSDEELAPRFFLHPSRLALVASNHSCWIIPFPPARPWREQLTIWAVLMLPLAYWLLGPRRHRRVHE